MARTTGDLRDGNRSWAEEVQSYEAGKRRFVHEGLMRGPQRVLSSGTVQLQERVFDPLLQRYRNHETEASQRLNEERERVAHLNKARDLQLLRSQPFDIINHQSHLDPVAPGHDPTRPMYHPRSAEPHFEGAFPDTQVDYNIVSNMSYEQHHWAKPDRRPRAAEKSGHQRRVYPSRLRDYNVLSNHYLEDHDHKIERDKRLNRLEAVKKHMDKNRFDPILQQFTDPRVEEVSRVCDDARDVEETMRLRAKMPPTYLGRVTEHYNMVTTEVYNPEALHALEAMEEDRKDHFKNRHIMEHNFHVADVKGDYIEEHRRMARVHRDRYLEHERGHCIVTNRTHGNGPKDIKLHEPYAKRKPTPWERAMSASLALGSGRAASTPPGHQGDGGSVHRPAGPRGSSGAAPSAAPPAAATAPVVTPPLRTPSPVPQAAPRSAATPPQPQQQTVRLQPPTPQSQRTLSRRDSVKAPTPEALGATILPEQQTLRRPTPATPASRALTASSSAAQLRQVAPPGDTRPMARSPSEPAGGLGISAVRTLQLPSPAAPVATPGATLAGGGATLKLAPPAPSIPGSPQGSVYSRPRG